jgi:hypothetical protein
MIKDQRKVKRRPTRLMAWVALEPNGPQRCIVSDISERGARIKIEDTDRVPDRFVLLLARSGAARRFCRVVWRQEGEMGVSFATARAAANAAPVAEVPPPALAKAAT